MINTDTKSRVETVVREAGRLRVTVDPGTVANHLKISEGTTRTCLMELSESGKVASIKYPNGKTFYTIL